MKTITIGRDKTRDEIIINNALRMSDEKGWTNVLLAEKAGTSAQHLNSMKKGRRGVGKHLLKRLADALNVPVGMLLVDKAEFEVRKYGPVLVFTPNEMNTIQSFLSGTFQSGAKEKNRMTISASQKVGKRAFGIEIIDHAMAPRFLPGDIAVIDPDSKGENEGIYAIIISGNVLIRRIKHLPDKANHQTEIRIVADNGQEPDIICKNGANLVILGKVVELYPKL